MADTTTLGESTRTVDGTESVRLATTGANWKALLSSIFSSLGREKLTANRTYYVRTNGSDSNTGLADTAGGAFLTRQHAYDVVTGTIDLGGYTVTIKSAAGSYTDGVNIAQPWTGGGAVVFEGDTTTPSNVSISTTSDDCFNISVALPGLLTIQGLKLATTTAGYGVVHSGLGTVQFGAMDYGAIVDDQLASFTSGAFLYQASNYTISGGATTHMNAAGGGYIYIEAITATLTGTPAFSTFAVSQDIGHIAAFGVTYTGSATGKRYNTIENSIIRTGSLGDVNYFPGSIAGTTATGGLYS